LLKTLHSSLLSPSPNLTKVGREIVANTFSPFETWLIIAAVYFAITFLLSILGHKIEMKMKKQGGM